MKTFSAITELRAVKKTEATKRPIHVAITYAGDGTIRLFRDGRPYGGLTNRPALFRFPLARPRSYSDCGTRLPVAIGCWRVPFRGRGSTTAPSPRRRSRPRLRASGNDPAPASIASALAVERRAERSRLVSEIDKVRSAMTGQARKAYAVSSREAGAMHVQIRGNPNQAGEVVAAGAVAAIVAPGGDFGLAADAAEASATQGVWLAGFASSRNPLFARVVVNRLWQAHFGTGLVEAPSDLGFNGGPPSHSELLDWLACEMVARGFSLKSMHRLIVSSSAFRQASRLEPTASKQDAGNRLVWHKAPMRLEAEMVRDAMLSISGILDDKLGGASFRDQEIVTRPGHAGHAVRGRRPQDTGT